LPAQVGSLVCMNGSIRIGALAFAVCLWGVSLRGNEAFEAKSFSSPNGGSLLYRIHKADGLEGKATGPLVFFLHGAGERGSDNEKQLNHGVADILAYARADGIPVTIVAPQCPLGKQWVDTPWGDLSHKMDKEPSDSMRMAMELLDKIIESQPVDRKRIYVTGLSMGGFGTWDIIQRQPKVFAAAMPVCGGGDPAFAKKLKKMSLWAFHGDSDTVVKTQRSRDMIDAIRKKGGNPLYTEYKNTKHNAWEPTYSDNTVLNWLFEQRR